MDSKDASGSRAFDLLGARFRDSQRILVGRARELALLRDELATAATGHGRLCLIGGEAGIGKTTLARDLARTAERLGARVLTGSCYDLARSPPYGPWLDLFDACERDPDLPPAPSALAGGQLAAVPDQAKLFADVRRFLAALAADQMALILLEDFHWADPASLDLLRHVGPHLRHWPILLVLTYRSDELAPGSTFSQHLPALVRETDAQRIDLHRLEIEDLRALVGMNWPLAHVDEGRLLGYLESHAEGNPFFATEILRTLEDEHLLRPGEPHWSLDSLDRVVVPPLLRQVIEERISRLGDGMRRPLAIASTIGHEVPLDLWAEVAVLDREAVLAVVDEAVAAHLLEAERDGRRVRFVHALTREALYDGILPPRRRTWHLCVAETLLERASVDVEAVAAHFLQAGDPRAVEWLVRAGERAQRAYAWLTAAERFRAAADLLDDVAGEERQRALLLHRIGQTLRFAYPVEANVALDESLELANRIADASLITERDVLDGAVDCYADHFRAGLTMVQHGITTIKAQTDRPTGVASSLRAWLGVIVHDREEYGLELDADAQEWIQSTGTDWRHSVLCWYLASAGHLTDVAASRERVGGILDTELAARNGIRMVAAFDRHGLAILSAVEGDPDAARRHWTRAREDFGDHHMLVAFTFLDELRDLALPFDAATPRTRRELAEAAVAALGRAGGALRPGVSPKLGWLRCLVMDGRWDEAQDILADLPHPGNCFLRRERTFARAVLARHRGEPEVAWEEIDTLLPEGPATEPGDIIHQEGLFLLRLATDLCLDKSEVSTAERWLLAHDHWLDWSGSVLGRAEGMLAWGRYHHAAGDLGRARSCLVDALDLATDPAQPLVQIGAHRLLGEIDTGNRHLDDARSHLETALTLVDTCDVPFERAHTLLAVAQMRATAGAPAEARNCLVRARAILDALGAGPSLTDVSNLSRRIGGPVTRDANTFGLTPREVEVLRLVAEGRSNPEIANDLFISTRTAATHVSNIYRKLNVNTRAEAVDCAHRHELLTPPPKT